MHASRPGHPARLGLIVQIVGADRCSAGLVRLYAAVVTGTAIDYREHAPSLVGRPFGTR